MITIDVYAIRDDGRRDYHLATVTAPAVPRVGEVLRVPDHAITYWIVEHVVWERLTAHPLVELWARPN